MAVMLCATYGIIVLLMPHTRKTSKLTPQKRGELITHTRQRLIALGCCLFSLMCA